VTIYISYASAIAAVEFISNKVDTKEGDSFRTVEHKETSGNSESFGKSLLIVENKMKGETVLVLCSLEYQTLSKVQNKISNPECYTPSSVTFKVDEFIYVSKKTGFYNDLN
jgi:hypothetical protein